MMPDEGRLRAVEAMAQKGVEDSKEALTLLRERGPKREAFERETNAAVADLEKQSAIHESRLNVLETLVKGTAGGPASIFKAFSQDPVMLILFAVALNFFGINPVELFK